MSGKPRYFRHKETQVSWQLDSLGAFYKRPGDEGFYGPTEGKYSADDFPESEGWEEIFDADDAFPEPISVPEGIPDGAIYINGKWIWLE